MQILEKSGLWHWLEYYFLPPWYIYEDVLLDEDAERHRRWDALALIEELVKGKLSYA
jgi:hypothetical protein